MTVTDHSKDELKRQSEFALAEYAAAHDAYIHYDNFAWNVGGVLIAGVFVFWGFVHSGNSPFILIAVGNLLVCLLMTLWLLYAQHNRELYLFKLHRIHEIESQLGMLQHLRFTNQPQAPKMYIAPGFKGHTLNTLIYLLASLGGMILGVFKCASVGMDWTKGEIFTILLNLLIVIVAVIYVRYLDKKTLRMIATFKPVA